MYEARLAVVKEVRSRLRRASRRLDLSELASGVVLTVAIAAGLWLLLAAIESYYWMGSIGRLAGLGLWATVTLAVFAMRALRPLLRLLGWTPTDHEARAARLVGERHAGVADRLTNLLELSSGKAAHAPPSFVEAAVDMLGRQLAPIQFETVEDFSTPKRLLLRSLWAPALLLLYATVLPASFFDASHRMLAFGSEFVRPAPFTLDVLPGDKELTRGDELRIEAAAEGTVIPEEAVIWTQIEGVDRAEQMPMDALGRGRFAHELASVRRPMRYRVDAGSVSSPWYSISVIERPTIRQLQLRVVAPAYTGLAPQNLAAQRGDVSALRGSRVEVTTRLVGNDIVSAQLEFDGGNAVPLEVEDGSASGSFTIREQDSYRIIVERADAIRNADPIVYRVNALDDAHPHVQLISPGPDEILTESLDAVVSGMIADDYGFSRLRLNFRLVESQYRTAEDQFRSLDMPFEAPRPRDQDFRFEWSLAESGLDPIPGDVIEYYVEVWDNDAFLGPKSAVSAVHRLRVPSLSEQYQDLNDRQDGARDVMDQILDEASEIRRDFDNIRNELRSKQEADWQDRRSVESLRQRQESIESRLDQLSEQMESVSRQMDENDLLSPETMEMYRELKRVVDEIRSPELLEALRELQEAIEQLDLARMQESLQDFQFNEEQYRQRLERSLELFKRARAQQGLEQAERMAKEVAEQQAALRELTERLSEQKNEDGASDSDAKDSKDSEDSGNDSSAPSEESGEASDQNGDAPSEKPQDAIADDQQRLGDDMQELEDHLEQVRQQMNELRSMPEEQLEQLREQLRQQQIPERMRQTGEQIREGPTPETGEQQQSLQEQLQQLQQQLGDMRSQMSGSQLQINISALRRTIRDVIRLSHDQEELQAFTAETGAGNPALREVARGQVQLAEGVSVVADSVQSLAAQIPEMSRLAQRHTGEALREMGRATEALAERVSRQAGSHQRAGMMHLNELALMLSDLLEQLMNQQGGGSGGGGMSVEQMAEQLQQMAQQQQQLNEQIQQMLNDMQGDRLSQDMQDRLRQMAGDQDEIRRQLRQLSRDPIAREALMEDLSRISQSMQETIEELKRRGASREMIERQQQILTRLLRAEESLQERERDQRRRARPGETIDRDSPPEIERTREMEQLRRDLIRALESDYAPDYQELIRRYFELLRRNTDS